MRHERTGYVYPAGDMNALVQIIESLCNNPAVREAIGARAADYAASKSWLNIAQAILQGLSTSAATPSLAGGD